MNAIFLSDVHLKDSDSVKTQLVLRFLEREASRFEKIFILGDLFDVWPGTDRYLLSRFHGVIKVLRQLVLNGHEVHYIEGNHDFRLGREFKDATGVIVHPDEYVEEMGTKRVYMVHGDLGNPKAVGYALFRKALRMKSLHTLKSFLPQKWVFDIGLRSSRASRAYNSQSKEKQDEIRRTYRATACRLLEKGYDVVLMGHTHLPDSMSVDIESRHCHYFNLGDWVQNFTYLEFDGTEFYTKSHPVKND